MNQVPLHEPVLVQEVLHFLAPAPGKIIIDCNLGTGGHTLAILAHMGNTGLMVGLDRDRDMLGAARQRIEAARAASSHAQVPVRLFHADHLQLPHVLAEALSDHPGARPDGILFDLGPSTPQLLGSRGFSWSSDDPLDMRMDPDGQGPAAAEIVNTWKERRTWPG
jgi:16S rRNA (cytosine1402-N4)-methyltransferase